MSAKSVLGAIIFHFDMLERKLSSYLGITVSERIVENPWVISNIDLKRGRVLDVGCCYSYLSHELIRRGYDVYGIDVNPYPQKHSKMKFYQADVTHTPFPDGYFNRIIAVSTIEHVGLGYFGDPQQNDGDITCMKELNRILKPTGAILMTVPYANQSLVTASHRIYDEHKLSSLIHGFTVKKREHYVQNGSRWLKVARGNACKPTVVCLVLKKEE